MLDANTLKGSPLCNDCQQHQYPKIVGQSPERLKVVNECICQCVIRFGCSFQKKCIAQTRNICTNTLTRPAAEDSARNCTAVSCRLRIQRARTATTGGCNARPPPHRLGCEARHSSHRLVQRDQIVLLSCDCNEPEGMKELS